MAFLDDDGGDVFTPGDPPHGVCIAFGDDTLTDNPTWVRLDDPAGYRLAHGWSISRGRASNLDKTGTGTAQVSFYDRHGILDPTGSGPFVTPTFQLEPMKQAAVSLMNPITGDWSTLFTGFVSSMNHQVDMWTDERGLDTVSMEWVDAFDLLNALELTPNHHGYVPNFSDFFDVYYRGTPANFPGEPAHFVHVDDHIQKLLDDALWPNFGFKRGIGAGKRNIFSGNVSIQGVVYSRRDSLVQALFDAADAEFPGVANVFISKTGVLTFHGRFARFHPERPGYGINNWLAGSLAEAALNENVAPIAGLEFRRSKEDIINACIASPQNATDVDLATMLIKDDDSIAQYGWRSLNFDNLLTSAGHDDDNNPTTGKQETMKFASYYVDNFKQPGNRVTQIRFRPRGADQIGAAALWAMMCGVEIGDVVSLRTAFPGGGGFDEDFFVEGIHYEASPGRADMHDITMDLDVTPASYYGSNPFGDFDDS